MKHTTHWQLPVKTQWFPLTITYGTFVNEVFVIGAVTKVSTTAEKVSEILTSSTQEDQHAMLTAEKLVEPLKLGCEYLVFDVRDSGKFALMNDEAYTNLNKRSGNIDQRH